MNAVLKPAGPILDHWIDGRSHPPAGGAYMDDRNPVDDQLYARAADGDARDVDAAVCAAQAAFAKFSGTLAKDREALLIRTADLLDKARPEFADVLIDEVGSPMAKAQFEIQYAIGFLRAAAGVPRRMVGHTIPSDVPGRFSMSLREPVGVIAGITPFNVPLIKAIKQSAMAVATGNTFVMLPSEEAPRLALRVARLWADAGLPPGVFNVVLGNGAKIGDALTGHPLVKAVTFTGSSRVGRHIAELAGKNLKKFTLELGGKSPMVIFKDADLDAAVQAAIFGMFLFQGQVCMGASRIFVERPIMEAFAQRFAERARGLPGGDLRQPTTMLGPIISPRQRERVRTHVADAVAKGARLLSGGTFQGNGCAATIFADVKPEMTLYAEETFGPVTALYPFDTFEQALEGANNTEYGLSASIFTRDIDQALAMARGIRSGMVHINAPTLHDEPHVPFGGMGSSGMGREGTEVDLDLMTEWKWVTIQSAGAPAHH